MSVIAVSLALNAVVGVLKVCVFCLCLCLVWYLCVCCVSVVCLMCLYGPSTSNKEAPASHVGPHLTEFHV
ncbi:hypothetical protein T492DRAFT_1096516, partial [Pavlovales sp. CCMP2436]